MTMGVNRMGISDGDHVVMILLRTTAKAMNMPQRHFSQTSARQLPAMPRPLPSPADAAAAGTSRAVGLRFTGTFFCISDALFGMPEASEGRTMGLAVDAGAVVGAIVVVVGWAISGATGRTAGVSGFPRSRSPMLGGSRAIGVQYCKRGVR